jgi:phage-related protein
MSLINNILEEWAYRVDNGMPNPNNPNHINELSTILTEMGMYEIKDELIRNLTEADEQFTNPILNKKIKYKGSDGKDKEGTIGNLLRLQKDHPGRKAAEAQLPPEDSEERKQINKDLGSGDKTKETQPQAKDSKEEPTAGDKPTEKPQTNPMFTKDADPAMAARIDTEKQTLDKLAKSDKPEQSTELEPVSSDPNSKAKQFKGELSGKDIQTIPMEGGGQIYGTVHRNRKMVDDIINHIKATIPEEKWKDIVFVGEGGSTNDSGELVFNDEMKYAAPKFKQLGAGIDTFDGDELDVHDDQSKLYKRQIEKTGFNQSQVKAGNWASMIGQGEGTDTMSPNDYLDNEGKKFLQDEAVNAGFPPIENWDEPTDRDIDTLYRLSFPEDYGDKETKINDIQVAFNEIRDESIIEKTKQLQSQGKIPITIAGESHVELVDKMMQKSAEPDSDFQPVEPNDVTKEMPKADYAAFSGQSDIDKLTKQERKEISMKIDELNKMTQDAIEKGEKAPNYNLCQVTVPGTNLYCDNNLGIPREDMPQFKGKPQPGTPAADMPVDKNGEVDTEPLFKQMLADRGVKVLDTEIPSDSLKATQSELVGSKVAGMTKALEKDPNHPAITAPIYVSRDGYVVDGHHRWAAVTSAAIKAGKPTDMKVRVIDMDAKDIIPMANKFAEEQGVAAKKADANQEGPKSDIANVPKVEDEKGTTAETPSGKKLYSVGGGYYSDRPDGEPKFIRTEVVARKAFLEGDEKSFLLIFEAEFSADVEGGEAGKFKEIPEKDRKDAAEDLKDTQPSTDTTAQKPTKKKGKKNKELDQTKDTKDEFNNGNLSKDGVTDEQFGANKKIKPTPNQIKVEEIEKFFLDKNGNTKFPKKYLKVLARMLSTKPGGVTISDFTNASGAGTLSSTMGELLTLMAVTIKDDNEAKEFFNMLRQHVKSNGKDSIIDIGWVNSAEKVRQTQFNRYNRKYGKGNWELDNMAWDVESEVDAMGMENYKQNKGFSTDVYAKVKVGGKYILDEISLKKEIKANLLNATSGRVADIMVRGLASDEDLVIYDDLNAKIDSLMGLKDAASKREKAELVAQRDAMIEKYNVNVPDDVKVSNVQKKQRLLHEDFVKKGVSEISGFLNKFCNKTDTKYRANAVNVMKTSLSQKDDYKAKVTEQLDSLCSTMPSGGFKTAEDYNNALKVAKIGDTSDMQKLNMALMSLISSENPQSQASKSLNMITKNSHNHSKAVRKFLLEDPAARRGLLGSIREAFPLKALFEGEENMILGDVSVDRDVLKDVFGVDSYDQLEQKLTVRDIPPPPSIVYRVVGPDGSNTDIPVAEIVSRPDGIGYGGSWKLIMAVHPDFAKKLKESNDALNSKIQ